MARYKSGKLSKVNLPSGEWMKNVGRSIGSLSSTMISNMMPSTFSTASNVSSEIQEMRNFSRDFKSSEKSLFSSIKEATGFNEIEKGIQNAKEDLKTGNLNNFSRGFDFDFSFEEDFNLDIDLDDEEIGNDQKAAIMTTKATIETSKATLVAMNEQTSKISNAVLQGSKANYNLGTATLKSINTATSQITAGIAAMNDNLSMLVQFNSSNMTNFVNVSMQYYNDSIDILKKILESQQSLNNRQQAPPVNPNSEIDRIKEDILSGYFNFKDFGKLIKNNRANSGSSMSMLTSMLDKTTISSIAENPLGFILPMVMQSMLPKSVTKSLKSMDSMFGQFIPGLLMKANGYKNSSNPLLQMIGNLLGVNIDRKTSVDLKKFGNGPIPFDGETKKAILEQSVYLRKICAAVTGKEEFMLDRTSNKFRNMSDIRKDYEDRMRSSQTTAFTDIMTDIRDTMKDVKFSSFKSQEEFMKQVEEFFLTASKKDGLIQNVNKRFDFGVNTIEDILDESGMDPDAQRLFKMIWKKIPKGKKANALIGDIIDSRKGLNRFFQDMENGDFTTAMNLDSDVLAKAGVSFKGVGGVDKHGKNTLDYLNDIETLLIKGIKVIPTISGGEEPTHLKEMMDKLNSTKNVTSSPNYYSGDTKYNYTEAELKRMKQKGQIGLNDLSDLYSYSDEELENAIQFQGAGVEKGKILSKIMPSKLYDKVKKGTDKASRGIDKITTGMYNILFGKPDDDDFTPVNIIDSFDKNIRRFFATTGEWIGTHILTPMHNSLFGDKGIITQIKDSELYGKTKSKAKAGIDYLLGEKNADGNRKGGLFSSVYGEFTDMGRKFSSFFTGRGFTNSKGEYVKPEGSSVFGEMKSAISSVGSAIKEKYVGSGVGEKGKGIITSAMDGLYEGIMDFKSAFTGKKIDKSAIKDQTQKSLKSIKDKLPKVLAWGGLGAGAALFTSGGGILGTLGGLFLPGGLLGGAIIGSGLSIINQSETMKKLIFGPEDKNGERMGGIISKDITSFLKKNKNYIIAGAGVGALKSMILGNGLIGSMFLPGGPIGGALLGMGTSIAYKSKVVQDFLFGEIGEDGERHNTGFVSKVMDKFKSGINSEGKKSGIKWGTVGAGAIGGAALSGIIGQFGLLGGMMTLGGSPLLGAMLGAASGIALSSEKWKNAIFGEDVEGTKKGGKLTKFANMFKVEVAGALRQKIDEYKFKFDEWFIKGVATPLNTMLEPISTEIKYRMSRIKGKGKAGAKFVTGLFKETIGDPIVDSFNKFIIKPMGKLTNKLIGGTFKLLGAIVSSPFKLGGWLGDRISEKQERRGLKHYRSGINEKVRNGEMGFFKGIKEKYFNYDAIEEAKIGEFGASYKEMSAAKARKQGKAGFSSSKYQEEALAKLEKAKEELNKKKEQNRLRREYAKQLGYDNFKGDKNMSWIYGKDVEFSKDKEGKITATRLGVPTTKTDSNVDTIKDTTQTIADKVTQIAKTIVSKGTSNTSIPHAGDEHKSKTTKGSTNTLANIIDKEQQEKKQEEKAKFVSRKNVAYQLKQSEENKKAKEEKQYRDSMLSSVKGVGEDIKEQKINWSSMFGKKGLLTMLMVGGFMLLGKLPSILSNLGLIGETTKENLKDTTSNAQLDLGKNLLTRTRVGKASLKQVDKFIAKKSTKYLAKNAGKTIGKEATEQTAESVMREAMEGGVKAGMSEGAEKAIKEGNQGIVKKFISFFAENFSKALNKVAASPVGKALGQESIEKISKEVTETVSKNLGENLAQKYVKMLGEGMARAGLKAATTIGTAGLIDIGFAAYDLVSGWCNPGNLFGVHDSDADIWMKGTAGIVKALLGFSFLGPLIDVLNEVISALSGLNIIRFIAQSVYKALAGEEKGNELDENVAKMNEEYEQALKDGSFDGTKDDYIKEQNKGWIAKGWDSIKNFFSFGKKKDKQKQSQKAGVSSPSSYTTGDTSSNTQAGMQGNSYYAANSLAASTISNIANQRPGGTNNSVTTSASSGRPGMGFGLGMGPTTQSSVRTASFNESVNFIMDNLAIPQDKLNSMRSKLADMRKAFLQIPDKMDMSIGRMFNLLDEEGHPIKVTDATQEAFVKTNSNIASIVDKSLDFFSKAKSKISAVLTRQKSNLNNFEPALNTTMHNITGMTTANVMSVASGVSTGNYSGSSSGSTGSSLWSKAKNVASNIWSGVKSTASNLWNGTKKLFGFGFGPEEGNDNFTYYSQNDPRWAGNYYGSINGKDTNRQDMATRGCAPTAMAMVASELTGANITPDTIANFSYNNGYSVKGGTDYNMLPSAANQLGINARDITQENSLKSALSSNKPVIAAGQSPTNGPGTPFTTGGHYVVMTGMKNGMVHVKDPLSPARNGYYDLRTVAAQTNKAFAFDRANNKKLGNKGDTSPGLGFGFGFNLFGFGPTMAVPDSNSGSSTSGGSKSFTGPSGADIVNSAKKLLGKPYTWGGNYPPLGGSPGTDCSGLCQWAYNDNGIKISRTTYTQKNEGRPVANKADLLPGDLILCRWGGSQPEHVVMVAAPGAEGPEGIIEAQKTGVPIKMGPWRWDNQKWTARRILSDEAASSGQVTGSTGGTASADGSTAQAKPNSPLSMFAQVYQNMFNEVLTGEKRELDWGTSSSSGSSSGGTTAVPSGNGNTQAKDLPIGKPKEFAAFLAPMAQGLYRSHNILPSITIAQAAEETGWGRYAIGNNIFGVKAFSDWKGKKINARTHEFYGGTKSNVDAWFRDYDSIEDCMADRGKVLSHSRYNAVRSATNYADAAQALYSGGYATNPSYPRNLISIIKSNNLNQYDTKGNGFGFGFGNIPRDSQGDAGATGMKNTDISTTNASRATTIARQVISRYEGSNSTVALLTGILQALGTVAGYSSIIADNTGNISANTNNVLNNNTTNISNTNPVLINSNGGNVINNQETKEISNQRQRAEMIAKGIF